MERALRASFPSCPICGNGERCDRHTLQSKGSIGHECLIRGGPVRTRSRGVWSEILEWLQKHPDVGATELMDRLIRRYPDRYSRRQLRILQRRVRQWRSVMANKLVYASAEQSEIDEERPGNIRPVGVNQKSLIVR